MKRGRISRVTHSNSKTGTNIYGNTNHIQVHYLGPSFSDLPAEILHNILPIKSVSVCKTWYDLISDPEFAKLHFDETCDQIHHLYHISDSIAESEKLYFSQPDKEDFQLKFRSCEHTYPSPGCVCNVKFSLDPSFELRIDQYSIANSCNGLLCFSLGAHDGAVIICNPVLGEFLNLPMDKEPDNFCGAFRNYGFGFSHVANKYKVVKMIINKWRYRAIPRVHIVGTKSWRDISFESDYFQYHRPTYVKGSLYWYASLLTLAFFDVENEYFGYAPAPILKNLHTHRWTALGVLAGDLCISFCTCFGTFHVWAMKGVEKTWSQVLSIDMLYGKHIYYPQPRNYFSDGSLLMFHRVGEALVLVDPIKRKFRYFKISETKWKTEDIFAHIPSLISADILYWETM